MSQRVIKYFGQPGTGKTTKLMEIVEKEVNSGIPLPRIGYFSFTKAAAEIIRGRLGASEAEMRWFRTLHGAAVKAMGYGGAIIGTIDYNAFSREYRMKISPSDMSMDEGEQGNDYNMALRAIQMAATTLRPIDEVLREMPAHPNLTRARVDAFAKAWAEFKTKHHKFDFMDMLVNYDKQGEPLDIDVACLDEAQDLSELQWRVFKKMASRAKRIYVVGDDDQCQPPGTMVRVEGGGQLPIEQLDPDIHRVMAYSRPESVFYGKQTGKSFKIAQRHFDGELVQVNGSRSTPNHRWFVKWDKKEAWCTYLMRRGDRWRCGMAKLFRSDGICHPWNRARVEGAESLYILAVYKTEREARVAEQVVAAKYCIPQWTWEHSYSPIELDQLYLVIPEGQLLERANRCLRDHGRDISMPFACVDQMRTKRSGETIWEQFAVNLLPGYMLVNRYNGSGRGEWEPLVDAPRTPYSGPVYSMDVEKYHSYIADDIASHNSIFKFIGGSEYGFLDFPADEEHVLTDSHRVPWQIGKRAEAIIKRVTHRKEKFVQWRKTEGNVAVMNLEPTSMPWRTWLDKYKDVLVLTRHRSGARQWSDDLRAIGVPHALHGEGIHAWKEAKIAHTYFVLRDGGEVFPRAAANLIEEWDNETAASALPRGKVGKKWCEDQGVDFGDNGWAAKLGRASRLKARRYDMIRRLVNAEGHGALVSEPKLSITTMHGAKGREADLVVIDPACTAIVRRNLLTPTEMRLSYVALTRAKKQVIVLVPRTDNYIHHFFSA